MNADGRVLRHDQGGDIVSEGQAYAMLIAQSVGDGGRMRQIWQWTSEHLQRPDGLISSHADAGGTVLDAQPATDADVLVAYALLRASGPDADRLQQEGRRIANAILDVESTTTPDGQRVLLAGPWARSTPPTVNPSYWMPSVFRSIANRTGDGRWDEAADSSVTLLRSSTDEGRLLPPDWAHLHDGRLEPITAPNGSAGSPQYGLDAQRVPVWFAADCSEEAQDLARQWWSGSLERAGASAAIALSLEGDVLDGREAPLPLLAAAAAAEQAGAAGKAARLRAEAVALAKRAPSYYGDAWVALSSEVWATRPEDC